MKTDTAKALRKVSRKILRAATFCDAILGDPKHPIWFESCSRDHVLRVEQKARTYRYISKHLEYLARRYAAVGTHSVSGSLVGRSAANTSREIRHLLWASGRHIQ